jgi:hypothetical protein
LSTWKSSMLDSLSIFPSQPYAKSFLRKAVNN